MFNVYALSPRYDYRDAIVGERAVKQEMVYLTEGGAHAAARLMARAMEDNDEVHFVVRPVGVSPFAPHITDWAVTVRATDDEIPF